MESLIRTQLKATIPSFSDSVHSKDFHCEGQDQLAPSFAIASKLFMNPSCVNALQFICNFCELVIAMAMNCSEDGIPQFLPLSSVS